jgi:hypothetical protein
LENDIRKLKRLRNKEWQKKWQNFLITLQAM